MTTALLIPASGAPVTVTDFNPHADPSVWAAQVGDPSGVDFITCREQGVQFVVGDTSLVRDVTHNKRVRWYLRGTSRWGIAPVRGDVLMIGIDEAGETVDLHPALVIGLDGAF